MGPVANICGLLFSLLVLASGMLSRPARPPGHRLVIILGGMGILALVFCTVSPDDDLFQQELLRPPTQCIRLSVLAKLAPKRTSPFLWAAVCDAARYPCLSPGTGSLFIKEQRPNIAMHFASSILIHSPPHGS